LASLLKGSRDHRWTARELEHIREQGIEPTHDGLLRLRANIPFSLFFRDGDILDTGQLLALSGELCLPDGALGRLQKLLWQGEPPERIVTVDNRAAYVACPCGEGNWCCWHRLDTLGCVSSLSPVLLPISTGCTIRICIPSPYCELMPLPNVWAAPSSCYCQPVWRRLLRVTDDLACR